MPSVRGNFITEVESAKGISDFRDVKTLQVGDCFGELALLTNRPRAATIVARTDLALAKLSKAEFTRILQKTETTKLENKINFLRTISAFKNWTRDSLQKLTYYLKPTKYKQGAIVYKENATSNEVFIVRTGEFKFYKQLLQESFTPSSLTQRRRSSTGTLKLHADIKGVREIFGIDDMIEGRPRTMTCECSSSTGALYAISKKDFIDQIQKSDSWDYFVKVHDQQEAWREQKLKRISRAEAFFKKLDEVSANQVTQPRVFMKTLLKEPSTDPPVSSREMMRLTLDLKCSSASPVRRLELQRSQTTRNLSFLTAKDWSIKRSLKNFHDRKASFEWRLSPVPRKKNYEFKASRPPPNFFASGKVALSARYSQSPQITGGRESPMPSSKEVASRITMKGKSLDARLGRKKPR
jgi:CRP-like cAMP-binding protein